MTNNSSSSDDITKRKDFWNLFSIIWFSFVPIGVLANLLILVVVKRVRSMHSVTNLLLCNLAVSDLVAILWPSLTILLELNEQMYTDFYCKVTDVIPTITFAGSIMTLCLLSVQRYDALVNTMNARFRLSLRGTKYAICVIWTLAFLLAVPYLIFLKAEEAIGGEGKGCTVEVKVLSLTILFLIIPILVTLYCCCQIVYGVYGSKTILKAVSAKSEQKVMKQKLILTTVMATAAFVIFYAPVGLYHVLLALHLLPENIEKRPAIFILYFMIDLKAILNPFLYAFQSKNFRQAVKIVFYIDTKNKPFKGFCSA